MNTESKEKPLPDLKNPRIFPRYDAAWRLKALMHVKA